MTAESNPFNAEDVERQHFQLFAEGVRKHHEDANCMRRSYPENVFRYQKNIDYWKERLSAKGLDKDPCIQKMIFDTEWLIAHLMINLQSPDVRSLLREPIAPPAAPPDLQ